MTTLYESVNGGDIQAFSGSSLNFEHPISNSYQLLTLRKVFLVPLPADEQAFGVTRDKYSKRGCSGGTLHLNQPTTVREALY